MLWPCLARMFRPLFGFELLLVVLGHNQFEFFPVTSGVRVQRNL